VATNDRKYVEEQGNEKIFFLSDFPFINASLFADGFPYHDLKEFLVEEMILAMSTTFVPSAPSSTGDVVSNLRKSKELLESGDEITLKLASRATREIKIARKEKKGTWEKMMIQINSTKDDTHQMKLG
jgi:isopentenyl phosphate kinase